MRQDDSQNGGIQYPRAEPLVELVELSNSFFGSETAGLPEVCIVGGIGRRWNCRERRGWRGWRDEERDAFAMERGGAANRDRAWQGQNTALLLCFLF